MAYGNKMKDNEMNLVYKYYGNFTAKENYIFRQLVFNSSMIYNKVNWYFLKNGFNSKLQLQIVRKQSESAYGLLKISSNFINYN